MPVTLADLRALIGEALTHTENPAILRLPEKERTVEGLARAYLPRTLWWSYPSERSGRRSETTGLMEEEGLRDDPEHDRGVRLLDLADPGTSHTLLVALALGMGLDPGVGGIGVMWERFDVADPCWILHTSGMCIFRATDAPAVANEPDPIRALEAAVRHVLEGR